MSQPPSPLDRSQRSAPRIRSLIAARIIFNNGQSTLDCLIRNLSDTGAKLSVSAVVILPDCFDLLISKSVTRRMRMAWQRGDEIGVRFEDAPTSEHNSTDAIA